MYSGNGVIRNGQEQFRKITVNWRNIWFEKEEKRIYLLLLDKFIKQNGLTYLYEIFNLLINGSGMGFVKMMYWT